MEIVRLPFHLVYLYLFMNILEELKLPLVSVTDPPADAFFKF